MTDQESLDLITSLVQTYPDVFHAFAYHTDKNKVQITFGCNGFNSLKQIADCAITANCQVTLGPSWANFNQSPSHNLDCIWVDILTDDDHDDLGWPTTCQIVGILMARELESLNLISRERLLELEIKWNIAPSNHKN